MTSFLNQIFYSCNKFDTIDCIELLEKYMKIQPNFPPTALPVPEAESSSDDMAVSGKYVDLHASQSLNEKTRLLGDAEEVEPFHMEHDMIVPATTVCVIEPMACARFESTIPSVLSSNDVYYPQKKNSLFWCAFISSYGYSEYHLIGNRFSNREMEVKREIIHYFMQNTKHFKNSNYKVTNGLIQEISAELMINKKPSLLECIAFSIFFKRHLFIVKNHTYVLFTFKNMEGSVMDSQNITIIHYDSEKGEYGIDLEPTMDKIASIQQEKVMLEHYEKPLKGASNYKVCELEDIARKLQMKSTVMLNKTELYKAVWDNMLW